ncbi:RHS repeat protein, partial [Streptomyces arenae]|nr:RHS repeat protein [Streptomyces arenae]
IGGPILAAIVIVAGAIVLADTLSKYAKGQATLMDVAFAAMDCIPGAKGLTTAAKLAKGAKALAKGGLKGMAKGLGKGGLRKGADDAVAKSKPTKGRCKNGDPIDMVTGEMIMGKTDFALPGLLPMVLRRTHLSTYRWGRYFGESWASTLDERLELDEQGVLFASEDGMILSYPVPSPGAVVMPAEGPRWPLEWDGGSAPLRITDPGTGHVRHFSPLDRAGADQAAFTLPLRAISDRNGHRVTVDREQDGTPTAMRHSGGHRVVVESEGGRIIRISVPGAQGAKGDTACGKQDDTELLRYAYDDRGNLTEIYNSSGLPFRLAYDDESRISSWTDRNGSWYRFTYDERHRVVRGQGADGFLDCVVAYDTERRRTTYSDSLGFTTTYDYNDLLQVTAETDALGNVRRSEWDRYNNLTSSTDANGARTEYTHDGYGNLTSVTRPDGAGLSATFNELRLPVEVVDSDGAVWRHRYDERGNLVETTDPTGSPTRYRYDGQGHLAAVVDALGAERRIECDAHGLPVVEIDPLGWTTRFERDTFGRIVAVRDQLGGTTALTWTLEGKLSRRTNADGTTERWSYDGEGNLLEHRAPGGALTRFETGHFNLTTARIDPDDSRFEFTYDTELRLREVRDARDLVWSYARDPVGNVVTETDFNGRTLAYRYDAARRLAERVNGAGQTTRFIRNPMGKVVEQSCDDRITTYAYDTADRLIGAENEHTRIHFVRDRLGRVVEESCNGASTRASYDANGRRTSFTTPSGVPAIWEYDAGNRPTGLRVAQRSMEMAYDGSGHEVERLLFPGVLLAQEWDDNHRLTRQSLMGAAASGSEWRRDFRYHRDGHLAGIAEQDGSTRGLVLDRAGRVVEVNGKDWSESYAYDGSGNVSSASWPTAGEGDAADSAVQGDRHYSGTLLHRAGRTFYEYDAQGRTVRKSQKLLSGKSRVWTYAWDAEDRLVRAAVPDGTTWHYRYDPLGRRVEKRHHGADGRELERISFVWDGARIAEQVRVDGSTREKNVTTWQWKPDSLRPVAQSEHRALDTGVELPQDEIDARFYAVITDLTGTPTELVDESGSVAWRSAQALWGSSTGRSRETGDSGGGATCPLRFPGQYLDEETGLHYNHFRYYEPDTARYQSPDPLGLAPAPNHHSYVPNPTAWVDPLGLSCDEADEEWTRVGRWMSDDEYNKMVSEGRVQPGAGDRSYVANPPDSSAYGRQAAPGTSYVEYDVPLSSLRPGGEPGWSQIEGPNSLRGRMAARKGLPLPEFPEVRNIEKIMTKEEFTGGAH